MCHVAEKVTPYSLGATEAFDMVYNGGKADDITVVVARLCVVALFAVVFTGCNIHNAHQAGGGDSC